MATIIVFLIAVLSFATNCKVTTAIALHCRFEIMRPNFDGIYGCSATLLTETRSIEHITAVFGTHLPGNGNADVLGLTIQSQNMEFFPTNIEQFFPHIRVIDFSNNSITSIGNNNLIPFPNLSEIYLADNRIASLGSNLFVGLNSLHTIVLSDNVITSIDSNLFAGLQQGIYINISNNNIRHVGHDLILPKFASIFLLNNTCVDTFFSYSNSHDYEIEQFKFNLLIKCPPTISLIESTLESRMFIQDLINRIKKLEAIIETKNVIQID